MNEVTCPACKGSGQLYSDLIGGRGVTCGVCNGRKLVDKLAAEKWLDQQPITRGEVKRMIREALVGVHRITKPWRG